jgi:hypothetical protein
VRYDIDGVSIGVSHLQLGRYNGDSTSTDTTNDERGKEKRETLLVGSSKRDSDNSKQMRRINLAYFVPATRTTILETYTLDLPRLIVQLVALYYLFELFFDLPDLEDVSDVRVIFHPTGLGVNVGCAEASSFGCKGRAGGTKPFSLGKFSPANLLSGGREGGLVGASLEGAEESSGLGDTARGMPNAVCGSSSTPSNQSGISSWGTPML